MEGFKHSSSNIVIELFTEYVLFLSALPEREIMIKYDSQCIPINTKTAKEYDILSMMLLTVSQHLLRQ